MLEPENTPAVEEARPEPSVEEHLLRDLSETTQSIDEYKARLKTQNNLLRALIFVLVCFSGLLGYFLYLNYQVRNKPIEYVYTLSEESRQALEASTREVQQPAPTQSATDSSQPQAGVGFKTYTNPQHGFELTLPADFEVTGVLATSLENWQAGEGITIRPEDEQASQTAQLTIEAAYDGYGPFFPEATIERAPEANEVAGFFIQNEQYEDGTITTGNNRVVLRSKVITIEEVPFIFEISYDGEDRNPQIESQYLEILNTLSF